MTGEVVGGAEVVSGQLDGAPGAGGTSGWQVWVVGRWVLVSGRLGGRSSFEIERRPLALTPEDERDPPGSRPNSDMRPMRPAKVQVSGRPHLCYNGS